MSALNFINNIGRNFRLGPMLGKQSIRTRMSTDEGLSFSEFSYQIFQVFILKFDKSIKDNLTKKKNKNFLYDHEFAGLRLVASISKL